MKKKSLIILVLLIIIIVFVLLLVLTRNKNGGLDLFPAPTPFPEIQDVGQPGAELDEEGREELNKALFVGDLLNVLPYVGNNFSLYYDYSLAQFVLYINPSGKEAGNAEFDAFLKKNKIEDRSWIDNLFTTYITPTPTIGLESPTPAP